MNASKNFDELMEEMHRCFEKLPEHRTGVNTQYEINDAELSGLGIFSTQLRSFLAYQRMIEGQSEKALEIALVIKDCPVEHKIAQDEGDRLLAGLQVTLPVCQVVAARQLVASKISPDQASAYALDYALGFVSV